MVLSMFMRKFITKVRRDLARDAVLRDGKRLATLRSARAGIDASIWPYDAAKFDEMIEALERRRESALNYLKTTAQEV